MKRLHSNQFWRTGPALTRQNTLGSGQGGQGPVATRSTLDCARQWSPDFRSTQPNAAAPRAPMAAPVPSGPNAVPRYAPVPQPPGAVVLRSPNPTIGPDGNPILPRYIPVPRPQGPTPQPTTSQLPGEYDAGS